MGIAKRRYAMVALAVAAVVLTAPVTGCSRWQGSGGQSPQPAPANAVHGPLFPECGGVSDQTVTQLTGVGGLVNTARNSVGCQWLLGGALGGPWLSFTWFRGSPIGRERKGEELLRARVDDITIDGRNGFMAIDTSPTLGIRLCDIGIQFNDDFFEWSVRFREKPFPDPCGIAKELSRQSIAAAK